MSDQSALSEMTVLVDDYQEQIETLRKAQDQTENGMRKWAIEFARDMAYGQSKTVDEILTDAKVLYDKAMGGFDA